MPIIVGMTRQDLVMKSIGLDKISPFEEEKPVPQVSN